MRLAYFDEVKYQKGKQPYYLDRWDSCSSRNSVGSGKRSFAIIATMFWNKHSSKETEFHAAENSIENATLRNGQISKNELVLLTAWRIS